MELRNKITATEAKALVIKSNKHIFNDHDFIKDMEACYRGIEDTATNGGKYFEFSTKESYANQMRSNLITDGFGVNTQMMGVANSTTKLYVRW